MPGFNINGAEGANAPNSVAEVRRTHRWIFTAIGTLENKVRLVLKTASRPSLTFEEPAMHHNQEQVYFAGKHTWEPLSLSWSDVEQDPDVSKAMFDWVERCLKIQGANSMKVETPTDYKRPECKLQMIDGQGTKSEEWKIYNGWPQAVNWNALDYSSSDLQLIEVKFRYDRAERIQT